MEACFFLFVRYKLRFYRLCNMDNFNLQSPIFQSEDSGSITGLSMFGLSWTNWHREMFLSMYMSFLVSLPFHQCFILIFMLKLLCSYVPMDEDWGLSENQCCLSSLNIIIVIIIIFLCCQVVTFRSPLRCQYMYTQNLKS